MTKKFSSLKFVTIDTFCCSVSRVAYSWQSAKRGTRVKHAGELKSHTSYCTTGQKSQTGQAVSSWLELMTQSNCEAKSPQTTLLWETLTFCIPNTHQYKYPLYPRIIESLQREFWERNPREKQYWLIHNFHPLILQIPLLLTSLLIHPWEVH